MEETIEIVYHWKADDYIAIPEQHKEVLREDALERIYQQIQEGNVQGELNTSVRFGQDIVPEEDEDDGINYSGWWKIKTTRRIL